MIKDIEFKANELLSAYCEAKNSSIKTPVDPIDVLEFKGFSVDYVNNKYALNIYGALQVDRKVVEVNADVKINEGMENFTIAHELGHLALGHTKKRMVTFSAISAVTFALSTILSRLVPYLGSIAGRYLSQILLAGLSRKDEFEADAYASALLVKAGIGISPQISLLEKINTLTGTITPKISWTMSHPSPTDRVKAIRKLASNWIEDGSIDQS